MRVLLIAAVLMACGSTPAQPARYVPEDEDTGPTRVASAPVDAQQTTKWAAEAALASAGATADENKANPRGPWFCATAGADGAESSSCAIDEDACNAYRRHMRKSGYAVSVCASADAAFCVWFDHGNEGKRFECHAQMSHCLGSIDVARTRVDDFGVPGECFAVPEDNRNSLEKKQTWWCTETQSGNTGGCSRVKATCEERRARLSTAVDPYDACEKRERAACYSAKNRLDESVLVSCFPTFRTCIADRSFALAARKTDWKVLDECTSTK